MSGLLRSIAHRLAGDDAVLPVEGRLASFDGATGLAQLGAADARGPARPGRPRRLLDLHLRQLAPDAALPPGLGRRSTPTHGLTIVGVHTPEFGFEHDVDNVIAAGRARFGVEYPIAIDNDYGVWRPSPTTSGRRSTSPTPRDASGIHHFGEGEYAMTEMVIQQLLIDAGADERRPGPRRRSTRAASRWPPTGGRCSRPRRTSATARAAASPQETRRRVRPAARLRAAAPLRLNQWALAGTWTVARHAGVLERARRTDRVPLPRARRQPRHGTGRRGGIDPVPGVPRRSAGRRRARRSTSDADGSGIVDEQRTYQLIRQSGPIADRLVRDRVPRRRRRGVLLHVRLMATPGRGSRLHRISARPDCFVHDGAVRSAPLRGSSDVPPPGRSR